MSVRRVLGYMIALVALGVVLAGCRYTTDAAKNDPYGSCEQVVGSETYDGGTRLTMNPPDNVAGWDSDAAVNASWWQCDTELPAQVDPTTIPGRVVRYVDKLHPAASDSGSATDPATPWATLGHATATAVAGDVVVVRAGTTSRPVYVNPTGDHEFEVANSGTPTNPIVFTTLPDEAWWNNANAALITGDTTETNPSDRGGSIRLNGVSHVQVRGLNFAETMHGAVRVEGPQDQVGYAEDILIWGNRSHRSCTSGIAAWGADNGDPLTSWDLLRNIRIESNLVEAANTFCANEAITVARGVSDVHVRFNVVRYTDHADPNSNGDEGIDFKGGVTNGSIVANLVTEIQDNHIYIDGGSYGGGNPGVANINVVGNRLDGQYVGSSPGNIGVATKNGISVTTEGAGPVGNIRIYNNVVTGFGDSGVVVPTHPAGTATVDNVHVLHNTILGNGLSTSTNPGLWYDNSTQTSTLAWGNIIWGNQDGDLSIPSSPTSMWQLNNNCAETICAVQTDPLLGSDFEPEPGSPVIDRSSGSIWSGLPGVWFVDDYRSFERDVDWDLGALEVQ